MPYLLQGRPISPDRAFTATTANGDVVQFPANWIRLASEDEKAAIGLTYEPEAPQADQRFYWGYDADGNLLPKDHAQLVEQWVTQTKTTAGSLLTPFDWYIVRETETGKAVPQQVLDYRAAVRVVSDNREVIIKGTTDTEQLAAVITGDFGGMFPWPRGPFDPAPEQPAEDDGEDTIVFSGGATSGSIL